jgi:acid phosphatase
MLHKSVIVLPTLLAACGASAASDLPDSGECRPLTLHESVDRAAPWQGTVFTIVMENKRRDEILGNPKAPYLNQLAAQGAVAAGFHNPPGLHPSEPNYIWMVSGRTFGIKDDRDPTGKTTIRSSSHLVDQIEAAGLDWRSYQESMGEPCGIRSHGRYVAKHDPFVYFADVNGWDGRQFQPSTRCQDHVVDYTELDADLKAGTVPEYVFVTPNLDNDMHDGSIARGDAWLAREVPKIMASDAYQSGGVLFVTWDEGSGGNDDAPFIVVGPNVKPGFVSQTYYHHGSYLKTVQAILGVEPLPCVDDPAAVPTMDDLFSVPLPPPPVPASS